MRRLGFIAVLLLGHAVRAQAPLPADCPEAPAVPGQSMSLTPFVGMPGGGFVGIGGLNDVSPFGTLCQADTPSLPHDVLHGDPAASLLNPDGGSVLRGAPGGNLLADPAAPP